MSQKIPSNELRRLRNEMPIREVIHAFELPWMQQDELCRFRCPLCKGLHTSVHPTENLGRCFDCQKNFNPIDLACARMDGCFHAAIRWLKAFDKCRKMQGFAAWLAQKRQASRMV